MSDSYDDRLRIYQNLIKLLDHPEEDNTQDDKIFRKNTKKQIQ